MFTEKFFIVPNVYHSTSSLDGYALVTGSSPLSAGAKLLAVLAQNQGGDGYIQVSDGYAQPTNGSTPILTFKIASGQSVSLDLSGVNCLAVKDGIVVSFSSTAPTYTDGGKHLFMTVFYI